MLLPLQIRNTPCKEFRVQRRNEAFCPQGRGRRDWAGMEATAREEKGPRERS